MMSGSVYQGLPSRGVPIAPAPVKDGGQALAKDTSGSAEGTMPYTCLTCVRRKVKCDKLAPKCSTCQKAKLECEYHAPPPRKRKRRDVDDIHDRLATYERILKDHGLLDDASSSPITDNKKSPSGNSVDQTLDLASVLVPGGEDEATHAARLAKIHKDGRLLSYRGKSRYVNSSLWRNLGDNELESSDDESGNEGQPTTSLTPANEDLNAAAGNMISPAATVVSLVDAHPSYETAMFLWKAFVDWVEPLTKLVHVPTTIKVVQRAASDPSTASKAVECLLFAIYHFAVNALTEDECAKHMQEPRATALQRYSYAASQAFTNASILRSTNMTVFQAYLIYLLGLRASCDPHSFWILTGIAVRLGQRLGVHRDGEELQLSPFETQMRRRFWWQLLLLDGLAGQSCGTGISLQADSWTTKQPLNLNDEDIWPEMTEPPTPQAGATDMIFCLCRAEVGKIFQRAYPHLGNWSKVWDTREGVTAEEMLKFIDDLEEILQDKYIRYCDIFQPAHGMTNTMVRMGMNVARFRVLISQSSANSPHDEARLQRAIALATKVLEYGVSSMRNPNLERFHWHLRVFFQWDCLAFILKELVREPSTVDPATIWPIIERVYAFFPDLTSHKRSLNIAIARLTIKAWDTTPSTSMAVVSSDPPFIATLRESFARKAEVLRPKPQTAMQSSTPAETLHSATNVSDPSYAMDTPTSANLSNSDFLGNFNSDGMDWEFWDRLIRDPYAFARE